MLPIAIGAHYCILFPGLKQVAEPRFKSSSFTQVDFMVQHITTDGFRSVKNMLELFSTTIINDNNMHAGKLVQFLYKLQQPLIRLIRRD
ncbi:hypothetical protein D3C74_324610 [compost metagenome]